MVKIHAQQSLMMTKEVIFQKWVKEEKAIAIDQRMVEKGDEVVTADWRRVMKELMVAVWKMKEMVVVWKMKEMVVVWKMKEMVVAVADWRMVKVIVAE